MSLSALASDDSATSAFQVFDALTSSLCFPNFLLRTAFHPTLSEVGSSLRISGLSTLSFRSPRALFSCSKDAPYPLRCSSCEHLSATPSLTVSHSSLSDSLDPICQDALGDSSPLPSAISCWLLLQEHLHALPTPPQGACNCCTGNSCSPLSLLLAPSTTSAWTLSRDMTTALAFSALALKMSGVLRRR